MGISGLGLRLSIAIDRLRLRGSIDNLRLGVNDLGLWRSIDNLLDGLLLSDIYGVRLPGLRKYDRNRTLLDALRGRHVHAYSVELKYCVDYAWTQVKRTEKR
jgi:hypothetical protein